MNDTAITSTVDFDRPGKQVGYLQIPRPAINDAGWANLFIPVTCIVNGRGPTVLVTAGVHGDEPEGQVAALNLARGTRPADVRGRLIILPCLSPEASRTYTGHWPSGANLNRSFPGDPSGPPHQQLADYLTRRLIPISDVVCDLHSGGRSTLCLPWSEMHMVEDPAQRRAMVDAMLAWGTDYHFVYINIAGGGLLVDEAERQGKITIGTELGGGGHVTAEIHRLARDGLRNFLRHTGVVVGEVETRASRGLREPVILRAVDADDWMLSPEGGLFETLVSLGQAVDASEVVGRLHFIERPDRPPVDIRTRRAGVVCAIRAIATTQQGDCLVVTGRPCTRDALL